MSYKESTIRVDACCRVVRKEMIKKYRRASGNGVNRLEHAAYHQQLINHYAELYNVNPVLIAMIRNNRVIKNKNS